MRFEIEDVNQNYHWPDESFDMVHARDINLAVRHLPFQINMHLVGSEVLEYRDAMEEMTRVLRPGGLFISIEWSNFVTLHPVIRADIRTHVPASCRFYDAINEVLRSNRDPHPIEIDVALLLSNCERFVDITATTHYVPIGSWPTDTALRWIGEINLMAQQRYADSVRPLLLDASWEENDVERLVTEYVNELGSVDGMATICYTVYASKI